MSIALEEGKYYKRADGATVGPVEHRPLSPSDAYPWRAEGQSYLPNGRYWRHGETKFDLLTEVPAPPTDDHAIEAVEGPQIAETPEWAEQVEAEAREERLTLVEGGYYRTRAAGKMGPITKHTRTPGWPWTYDDGRYLFDKNGKNYGSANYDLVEMVEQTEDPVLRAMKEDDIVREPMADIKAHIADEAKRIVSGARRSAYGTPEQNFDRIARFWDAYFVNTGRPGVHITAADVSPLMRLMKEARLCETPDHLDSHVDLVGYTLTGAEVAGVKPPSAA